MACLHSHKHWWPRGETDGPPCQICPSSSHPCFHSVNSLNLSCCELSFNASPLLPALYLLLLNSASVLNSLSPSSSNSHSLTLTHTHTHTQYKALPGPARRHRSSGCGLGRESQIKQRLKRQQIDADLSLLNNTTLPSTMKTCQPCMARFVVLAAEILSYGMVCDMMICNIYNIDAM